MEREMSYRALTALAALNKEYGEGRIDRSTFERLHAALATPKQQRAVRAANELHQAVEDYVRRVHDALSKRIEVLEALEQRVAELERTAEAKAEGGDRWLKAV